MLALALGLATSAASAQTPSPLTVHNNAMDFVEFWDAAKGLPKEKQMAQFKARVSPAFPAFYGIERYNGKVTQAKRDSQIQRAIDEFAPIRDAYITKARNFEAELPSCALATRPGYRLGGGTTWATWLRKKRESLKASSNWRGLDVNRSTNWCVARSTRSRCRRADKFDFRLCSLEWGSRLRGNDGRFSFDARGRQHGSRTQALTLFIFRLCSAELDPRLRGDDGLS